MKRVRLLVAGLLAIAGLSSCDGSSTGSPLDPSGRSLSTSSFELDDVRGGVIVGGVLRVRDDGCLLLPTTKGSMRLTGEMGILWPADFTGAVSKAGQVTVRDADGQVVAKSGQEFAARGSIEEVEDVGADMTCTVDPDGYVVVVQSNVPPFADWHGPDSHVVTLYHCGVNPTRFEGRIWRVPPESTPIDEENVPRTFVGRGTMLRVDKNQARFVDESGVELTFLPKPMVSLGGCM